MVKIEPYDFQKKTNIKEHNDMVDKINQIVDVINNTNVETIGTRLDAVDEEIRVINNTDSLQWVDIEKLKSNDSKQDTAITEHTNKISDITNSLVSNVTIVDGYNSGTFKVRIDREGAVSIDSNEYALESPTSIELIQGTGPSMFKCQISLSDGRTLVSNDFVFTTEYIGQDIYISSFTFKTGNVDGTISADIGLSNGVTIEANNFVIPTPPTVANSINDLNSRVESLENTTVSDARITAIETKNTEQDALIEQNSTDIQLLTSDIETLNKAMVPKVFTFKLSDYVSNLTYGTTASASLYRPGWIVVNIPLVDKNNDIRFVKGCKVGDNGAFAKPMYPISGQIDYIRLATDLLTYYNIPLGDFNNLSLTLAEVLVDSGSAFLYYAVGLRVTITNGVVTKATSNSTIYSLSNEEGTKIGLMISN